MGSPHFLEGGLCVVSDFQWGRYYGSQEWNQEGKGLHSIILNY